MSMSKIMAEKLVDKEISRLTYEELGLGQTEEGNRRRRLRDALLIVTGLDPETTVPDPKKLRFADPRGAEKPYGKEWEKHAMRHPKTMASVIRYQGKRIVELVRERDALQAEVVDAKNKAAAGPLLRALQGLRDRGMIDDLTMARAAERLLAEYPEHEAGHGAGCVTEAGGGGE